MFNMVLAEKRNVLRECRMANSAVDKAQELFATISSGHWGIKLKKSIIQIASHDHVMNTLVISTPLSCLWWLFSQQTGKSLVTGLMWLIKCMGDRETEISVFNLGPLSCKTNKTMWEKDKTCLYPGLSPILTPVQFV